jgi:CBS domain-containing protein
MILREILDMKGGTVFSIGPNSSLSDAVSVMVNRDIGSLVVVDGSTLAGMLTFREVLTALEAHGGSLSGLRVRDVMLKEPACGGPEDSLESLRELMNRERIRYLPVKQGGQLLGVISFHDVANAVIKETSFHNRLLKSYIRNWPEEESAK